MAHPFASHREDKAGSSRAKQFTKGYAKGGKVKHDDEKQDRALIKKMMKEEDKGESMPEGKARGGRLDKFARGGKTKGKHKGGNHVNIAIVAPGGKKDSDLGAAPGGPPMLPPPGGAPGMPPGLPPGGPAGGPPGLPPGMPPPGMPPMKRGGRAYAKGGKVPMTAGAISGEGRLQKIKAYGKNARKG